MSYGYSARLIETNKKANQKLLGVKLGKVCIRGNTSVADISEELGVSRQTIYNWFCGRLIVLTAQRHLRMAASTALPTLSAKGGMG